MLRLAIGFCLLMIVTGCNRKAMLDPTASLCDLKGLKLRVPVFTIRRALSDAAAKRLRDSGESIKGFINSTETEYRRRTNTPHRIDLLY